MEKHTTNHTHSSQQDVDAFVKKNWSVLHIVVVGLLWLTTIFSAIAAFKPSIIDVEQLKVWGPENFAKVMELYNSPEFKKNMSQNIEASLAQVKWQWAQQPNQQPNQQPPAQKLDGKLDSAQIQSIKKNAYVKWNPNAKITVIEYSDFTCPHCEKQYNDQSIEKLVQTYPQDVQMIFKTFVRADISADAATPPQLAGQTLECVGSLKNTDAYYKAIGSIFASNLDVDSLSAIGTSLGISQSALKECISSNKDAQLLAQHKNEWSGVFGINGTPGTVIINNESGEYILIPGAVPYPQFESAVKKLLGK